MRNIEDGITRSQVWYGNRIVLEWSLLGICWVGCGGERSGEEDGAEAGVLTGSRKAGTNADADADFCDAGGEALENMTIRSFRLASDRGDGNEYGSLTGLCTRTTA
jgi:hypothetical protein